MKYLSIYLLALVLVSYNDAHADVVTYDKKFCTENCGELLSCSVKKPTSSVKKKVKKKAKKHYKVVTLPECKMVETQWIPLLEETPTFNPRWNMPLPPLRDTPINSYPVQGTQGTVPNFSTGNFIGGAIGFANGNTNYVVRNNSVTNTPVSSVPLPASALLFLPAFSWLMLRRK